MLWVGVRCCGWVGDVVGLVETLWEWLGHYGGGWYVVGACEMLWGRVRRCGWV